MFCRVCLAEDVKMHTVIDTPLQELYEKVTNSWITDSKLKSPEDKSLVICYMCHALLRKCQLFQRTAERSNAVLSQLCFEGITPLSDTKLSNFTLHNYTATPIEYINLYNPSQCEWRKHDDSVSYETDRDGVKCESVKEESSQEDDTNVLEIEFTSDQSKTSTPFDSDDDLPLKMLRTTPLRKRKKQNKYKEETRQRKAKDIELDCRITNLTPAEQEAAMQERATSVNYQNSVFKCSHCYRGFLTPHAYDNHMEKHDDSRGEYACQLCALRYRTPRLLRAHRQAAHERLYVCNKCSHTSLTRNQASDHERLHSGEFYECKLCGRTFHARTSYLSHMRSQHPAQPKLTVCSTCGERFVSGHGLRMHRAKSHRVIHGGVGEEASQPSSAPCEDFTCKDCGEALISEQELRAHKELKHNKTDPSADSYCSHCDIQFATRHAWINHVLITPAHRQLAIYNKYCPICEVYVQNGIHNHIRYHEQLLKKPIPLPPAAGPRLACDQCELSFATKARLTAHVRRIHLGLKYNKHLVCELCGKQCTSAATLRYHQRTHTGERPHPCTVPTCGKRFSDTNQLRIHQRTHTGERPYSCDRCGKRFAQKPALNRHYRVHTGAKPYSCDLCTKSFSQSNSLNTHVKAVHLKMPSYRRLKSRSTYVRKNTSNEIRKNNSDNTGMNELTSHVKMSVGDVN